MAISRDTIGIREFSSAIDRVRKGVDIYYLVMR